MFSGLVEAVARVVEVRSEPPGKRLLIDLGALADGVQLGDSIAINGCCLTVVEDQQPVAAFEAGPETLQRTNLGQLVEGASVNIERSLVVGQRLGGHFVTGHVDGLGQLAERSDEGDWSTFWITAAAPLTLQMAAKGSIAVDGVSLTLVDVLDDRFSIALIPHTLQVTTLGRLEKGDRVNLETDLLAKYVQRQLAGSDPD